MKIQNKTLLNSVFSEEIFAIFLPTDRRKEQNMISRKKDQQSLAYSLQNISKRTSSTILDYVSKVF